MENEEQKLRQQIKETHNILSTEAKKHGNRAWGSIITLFIVLVFSETLLEGYPWVFDIVLYIMLIICGYASGQNAALENFEKHIINEYKDI